MDILNGKTFGDFFGKYTVFPHNGYSVVDYCIVSEDLNEDVIYFHVHDHLPHLSDHAKLSLNYQFQLLISVFRLKNIQLMICHLHIGGLKILLFYFKKRLIRLM